MFVAVENDGTSGGFAGLVDRLLGLNKVSAWGEETSLQWQHELPLWVWAVIVVAIVFFSGWSYYKLMGPLAGRIALSIVRMGVLLLVAVILAGPMLVLKQEDDIPDVLVVLFDRSDSMNIRDMKPVDDQAADYITRDEAMQRALEAAPELFTSEERFAGKNRQILWLGFDGETFAVEGANLPGSETDKTDDPGADEDPGTEPARDQVPIVLSLPEAQGRSTAIRTAIEQAMQRVAGRPIAGVVLFSDGRSPEATGGDVVRRLAQQGVGVFAVPLGSDQMPLDLAVGRVDHPKKAFTNDVIPVTVSLENYGDPEALDPARVTVRLVEALTGETLDEETGVSPAEPVRLQTKSKTIGEVKWRVEVEYEETGERIGEIITENNTQDFALELVDRPIRVLLVDGYPRWEFRYLRSLLIREKSFSASTLLLSADENFAQEGNDNFQIRRMPHDAEEIERYDVVIIGDVPSRYFGPDLMGLIRDHTSVRGAGLLWIGGEYFTPRSYETTPLADLMPMRQPGAVQRLNPALGELAMRPTDLARSLDVLRIRQLGAKPEDVGDEWPAELSPLLWAQDLGPLKYTTEVLAESQPISELSGSVPLVVRMRYGAGQSMYVATDETWRWRFGRGEFYFEQFWVQLVRMLGRHRLQQDQGTVLMSLSERQVKRGNVVVVDLTIRDSQLLQRNLPSINVDVIGEDGSHVVERLELQPEGAGANVVDESDPLVVSDGRRYRAQWVPRTTGQLTLKVVEPGLFDLDLTRTVDVFHPDDEKRQPLPDHDRLRTLAEQTGGQFVALDSLEAMRIPNRAMRIPNDVQETVWDSYLALLLVLLLATVEWIGRKVVRLV